MPSRRGDPQARLRAPKPAVWSGRSKSDGPPDRPSTRRRSHISMVHEDGRGGPEARDDARPAHEPRGRCAPGAGERGRPAPKPGCGSWLRHRFVPVPWQPVFWMLRLAGMASVRLPFRADSLWGLAHPPPRPGSHDDRWARGEPSAVNAQRRLIPNTLRKKLDRMTSEPSMRAVRDGITIRSVWVVSSGPNELRLQWRNE
jgi:hypothetical protein